MKKIASLTLVAGILLAVGANAQDGSALFKAKMCGACHGAGKTAGDLKDSKMDKAGLVKFMKDPKAVNPAATMKAVTGSDAELGALADYVLGLKK